MILKTFKSECLDPYYNLAVEQHLLETVNDDTCILYLWQNQNTVVIGRNQNAWSECRTSLLESDGGLLARRLSGGGAVFHDIGNLNFTFLAHKENYDTDRQFSVIKRACELSGLKCELSGRNDLLIDKRKFSGNAFYKNGKQAYHHGTLLINTDFLKLERYLVPSNAKLKHNGVSSVRSRVVNLSDLNPDITVQSMSDNMIKAFEDVYSSSTAIMSLDNVDSEAISHLYERNRTWEWNYGHRIPFTCTVSGKYQWGEIRIDLNISHGRIIDAAIYTDAMDWNIPDKLKNCLLEKHFFVELLKRDVLRDLPTEGPDILELLRSI